jgi:acetyl esterase/lipase
MSGKSAAAILPLAMLLFTPGAFAAHNGDSVPLWANGAPGSETMAAKPEILTPPAKPGDSTHVSSIHNPSLLVYLPPKDKATGAAMIVAPGGGHQFLSIDTEGTNVAEWLNSVGGRGLRAEIPSGKRARF